MDMNVLVAADSALLRAGLTRLLDDAGLPVVAQADDAADAAPQGARAPPDVVVLALAEAPRREDLDGVGVLVLAERRARGADAARRQPARASAT